MAHNALRRLPEHKTQPLGQPRYAADVMRSRLQPVRQEIRHFRRCGIAARSARQQRLSTLRAEQDARTLGTQQALVSGHGDEIRPQLPQGKGQHPGGLGSIDDKRDLIPAAQRCQRLRR